MKLSLLLVLGVAVTTLTAASGCKDEPVDQGVGVNPNATEPSGPDQSDAASPPPVDDAMPPSPRPTTCGASITILDNEVLVETGHDALPILSGGEVTSGRYSLARDVMYGTPRFPTRRAALLIDDDVQAFTMRMTFPDEVKTAHVKFKRAHVSRPSGRIDQMLLVWPVCAQSNEGQPTFFRDNESNPPRGPSTEISYEATRDTITFILPTQDGDELYRFERR